MPPKTATQFREAAVHPAWEQHNAALRPGIPGVAGANANVRFLDYGPNEANLYRRFQHVEGITPQLWMICPRVKLNNSFWRAFSLAYAGFEEQWTLYKFWVSRYLDNVMGVPPANHLPHPRQAVYATLNNLLAPGQRLQDQAAPRHPEVVVQHPMWQVMADLFNIELVVISLPVFADHPASEGNPYQIYPRGQYPRQQIFLSLHRDVNVRAQYHAVIPVRPNIERLDYHLAHSKNLSSIHRHPATWEIHGNGIRQNIVIEVPPPIRPPPILAQPTILKEASKNGVLNWIAGEGNNAHNNNAFWGVNDPVPPQNLNVNDLS